MKNEEIRDLLEEINDQLSRGRKLAKATQGRLNAMLAAAKDAIAVDTATKPKSFVVEAWMKTDDGAVKDSVDIVDWLENADNDAVEAVCKEPSPGEATDAIYWFYDRGQGSHWNRNVMKRMAEYLNARGDEGKNAVGFSVRVVDLGGLFDWVQQHRPRLYVDVKDYRE
jgi:hypothetical protein